MFSGLRLLALFVVAVFALPATSLAASFTGTITAAQDGGATNRVKTSDPSISLNQSNPALGSSVTFTTVYPNSTKNPRIDVQCYQNGVLVYAEAGSVDHVFVLGGYASDWKTNGGPATCTARLWDLIWNGNNPQQVVWLATTSFNASA